MELEEKARHVPEPWKNIGAPCFLALHCPHHLAQEQAKLASSWPWLTIAFPGKNSSRFSAVFGEVIEVCRVHGLMELCYMDIQLRLVGGYTTCVSEEYWQATVTHQNVLSGNCAQPSRCSIDHALIMIGSYKFRPKKDTVHHHRVWGARGTLLDIGSPWRSIPLAVLETASYGTSINRIMRVLGCDWRTHSQSGVSSS